MPLSHFALDKFVSQQISKLTKCNAIDLSQEFNQADSWIENYVLNSILCIQVKDEYKPFIFGILRRAQMALVEYENGRKSLKDYADGDKNRISIYFRSLYHFEIAISLTYQAHELFMKITGARLFEKNDNSQLERLNRVYNVSKHLEPSNIPNSHLHDWRQLEILFALTHRKCYRSRAVASWGMLPRNGGNKWQTKASAKGQGER